VRLLLLSVGPDGAPVALPTSHVDQVEQVTVMPDAGAVDAVLAQRDERRLVIDADLAGLALVLQRLMRRGELATAETAVVARDHIPYLHRIGLPSDRNGQAEVAVHGRPRLVGVIKDDSGGLCVDSASVAPWNPSESWWLRAVVDDRRLCDGAAGSLSVRRIGADELEATVARGRFRKRVCRGRSLQLACDAAQISSDGVPRERPRRKRTFWSEPTLWNLAL
jgi:hypothetical protein